jgi:hypothetical protein
MELGRTITKDKEFAAVVKHKNRKSETFRSENI